MTISSWLGHARSELETAGITTARLDSLVLLSDELGQDKAWLLSHPEYELQGSEIKNLNKKIVQRAIHTPLAYLRGKAEFYGREFAVNTHTLVPRPETETMIELLKPLIKGTKKPPVLVDVGTGSGAIAVTAKLEFPAAQVLATDIDPACLRTADVNARTLGAAVTLLEGDLLEPVIEWQRTATTQHEVLLLCNLPYVPDTFHINRAASHEPRRALFGGPDGLDVYRKLFTVAANFSRPPRYILTEALPTQHPELQHIAQTKGYQLERTDDFIQVFALRH